MKKITSYIAGVATGLVLISAPILADSFTKTIDALMNFTTVKINGQTVQSDNFVVDGKTYVWIRDVANMFGKEIEWDEATNTANIVDELTQVVATVNDTQITNSAVKAIAKLNTPGEITPEIVQKALDYEIDSTVILNKAAQSGISSDEESKNAAIQTVEQTKQMYGEDFLAPYNIAAEAYQSILERDFVINKFYNHLWETKTFTDEQMQEKYAELADSLMVATAKHILIKTSDKSDEEALKQINKIKAELKSVKMFDEVMAKYSEDIGTKDDPNGMAFGKNQMVPEFENAAFTQKVGVIGEPIKTQYGYHIVLVTERKTQPFEEAYERCKTELFRTWFDNQLSEWKNESDININQNIFDEMVNSL